MRNHFSRITLGAAALALATTPAVAQDGLGGVEGLFEEVNAITVFLQFATVTGSDNIRGDNLYGAGTEVIIDLNTGGRWDMELGLGASFLRGYEATEPSLDLRTSLRALPTISLYASPLDWDWGSWYAGLSFGLVELWNAQAYDDSLNAWDIEARTFELGGSTGFYFTPLTGLGVFIEGGYRHREFPSVKWTLPDGETLPESWPKSLDFSGFYAQIGGQLRIKEDADDRNDNITPPAPSGVWTLDRMDGAELPGTLSATSTDTTQVLHAVLRLTPDTGKDAQDGSGSWRLELHLREQPDEGEIKFRTDSISGTYTTAEERATRKHVLTLVPINESGGPRQAERLAGRLFLNWNGHVLIFAPGNANASDDES